MTIAENRLTGKEIRIGTREETKALLKRGASRAQKVKGAPLVAVVAKVLLKGAEKDARQPRPR